MARGKYYTDEEDCRLTSLWEDNKELRMIDLAKKAQRYGLCAERSEMALSQHISSIVPPVKVEPPERQNECDEIINDEINLQLLWY